MIRFGEKLDGIECQDDGQIDPRLHIELCTKKWQHHNVDEWLHLFVHTLDTSSRNWYTEIELRRGTENWPLLVDGFELTFNFESEYPKIDDALGSIKVRVFEADPLPVDSYQDWAAQLETTLECYNLAGDEDEEPRNISILESEGTHEVQGLDLEIPEITKKVRTKKINIGIEVDLKFTSIGDYWDEEIVGNIADLLQENQDLFPTKFIGMKGMRGDLGVMRIPLKEGVKPIKQCPYRLNPHYKQKVKQELNKMIVVGIIEAVEESEWISPRVIQDKKEKGEIIICVDLRKLNDTSLHDPFPTPFTDEVLDNVGGQEVYPFIDGFLGYHHIIIHE